MNKNKRKVGLTELVLRDGQQSLIATRMKLDDMLEVAKKMDQVGYWSIEMWGGATYDSCLRYLNEDPWHRLRELKKIFKKTKLQMLIRGKNLVGYKPYSDEIVKAFIEKASKNGIDVFRTFDALNDFSNIELSIKEVKKNGMHAQGAMAYTVSPVHTLNSWLDLAKQIEDAGADSVAIKDMAGLLKPNAAFELVSELKQNISIPVHMQTHATTGFSTRVSVVITYKGFIGLFCDLIFSNALHNNCKQAELSLPPGSYSLQLVIGNYEHKPINQINSDDGYSPIVSKIINIEILP